MKNFWQTLDKPFFVLAPMEDVTDVAFRALIAEHKAPDVTFTEFTSADGLLLAKGDGLKKLERKLEFTERERPIVAQLFSSVPEYMEEICSRVAKKGFDGIDINMGCPIKNIVDQGCGAAMIKNPEAAKEIIRAAKRGAGDIPVSVKTRVGYSKDEEMDAWVRDLLSEDIAALTIHARTRKDMSKVPARWELVKQAVEIRDEMGVSTLILGNGDAENITDARKKVRESGCDGVMLGRAIYGNPWLFLDRKDEPTREERIEALLKHLDLFQEKMADVTNYAVMKKHFKAYITGWDNAKDLRASLMETENTNEATEILANSLK